MKCSFRLVIFFVVSLVACRGSVEPFSGHTTTAPLAPPSSRSKGRVVRAGSKGFHQENAFDLAGHLLATTYVLDGISYAYQFEYGYAGGAADKGELGSRITSTLFPDGERLASRFDAAGAVQQRLSFHPEKPTGDLISGRKKLNAFQQLDWSENGDGTKTFVVYDDARRLARQVTVRQRDAKTLQAFGYRYDRAQRLIGQEDFCSWKTEVPQCCDPRSQSCARSEPSAVYTYDASGALRSAEVAGITEVFGTDALGNLTKKGEYTQTYNDAKHPHALTRVSSADGAIYGEYDYDVLGSMTRMSEGGVVTQFSWNALGMPTKTTRAENVTQRFYLGETLYKRRDIQNGQESVTYFLPGLRIENGTYRKNHGEAERESNPGGDTPESRLGTLRFFHSNHLGSATLVTDVNGEVLHRAVYGPFGEPREQTGAFTPKRTFSGKEREVLSGLYDFGARLYHPRTGRFLSADSLMDGLNPYSYVYNNPLNYVDPTGHKGEQVCVEGKVKKGCVVKAGNLDTMEVRADATLEMGAYHPSLADRAYSAVCSVDPRGLCSSIGQLGRYFDHAQAHPVTRPTLTAAGFLPGWTGFAAGMAEAKMYGGNVWLAGALGSLGILRNIHLPALQLERILDSTSTVDAFYTLLNGRKTGYVVKTIKSRFWLTSLNDAQRRQFARELVDITNQLRVYLPEVPQTALHPDMAATLLQKEVVGLELNELSGFARINAYEKMEEAIHVAKLVALRHQLTKSFREINWQVDENATNFRFRPDGTISGWFDPFVNLKPFQ